MFWLWTAEPADQLELERMLWLAVHWDAVEAPPPPDPLPPQLGRYMAAFGARAGDFGVVAEDELGTAGAAWYRLFGADEPGYGFVSRDVPELSVAVVGRSRSA